MDISVIEFTKIAAYIVIFGFLWRALSSALASKEDGTTANTVGRAMAVIY